MTGDLGNSLGLPFEGQPPSPAVDEHTHLAGGVVVLAAYADVPEVGRKPALIFRFAAPTGEFYPPFMLVTDDDQMANLVPLIEQSVAAARRGAGGSPT